MFFLVCCFDIFLSRVLSTEYVFPHCVSFCGVIFSTDNCYCYVVWFELSLFPVNIDYVCLPLLGLGCSIFVLLLSIFELCLFYVYVFLLFQTSICSRSILQ